MFKKIYSFHIDIFDVFIYVIVWAGMWNIYDYYINKYYGNSDEAFLKGNIIMLCIGTILLFIRNLCIYQYR